MKKYTIKLIGYDTCEYGSKTRMLEFDSVEEAKKWCKDNSYMGGYDWYVDTVYQHYTLEEVMNLLKPGTKFKIVSIDEQDKPLSYFDNKNRYVNSLSPQNDVVVIVLKLEDNTCAQVKPY